LYPHIAYVLNIGFEINGSTLIVGCNLPEITLSVFLEKYRDVETSILCSYIPKFVKGKFKIYNDISYVRFDWNNAVIGFDKPSLIFNVLDSIEVNNVYITVYSRLKTIPVKPSIDMYVKYYDNIRSVDEKLIEDVYRYIGGFIKTVSVKDIEEAVNLLKIRGLGVIIDLTR